MHTRYLYILVLMLGSVMGLQALDRLPMANFSAGNYPCNTKMPWVDSSFTGLSASVIDPAANGLSCTGSNSGTANLLDNNLSNFATINFTLGLGGCNSTLSVVDNDAGDTYAAGTFAGFRIGTAGLLGVSIGSSITIATYNNGNPVESQVVVNSGLGLNSSLLNGDGTATVGFISTAAFDEIRITYQSLISALFTGTVYHAVVQRYCAGPSLACNVQTRMNNPTFPTIIDGANTGLSGGACVGCSVNDAENAISNSSSDFATIVLTAALGTTGSIAVKDQITDYAAGTFAGFDISNPNLINANLLSGITIRTYKNGTLRESSNSGTLVSVGSSLLTGAGKQTVGFVTTLDFDEVKIEVTNLLGVASTTNVYGAVFQSFCAGPAFPCNTLTALATPTYPVLVAGPHTGVSGVACVLCSIDSTNNLIDNLPNNSARINLTAGVGAIGSIAVRDQLTDYPAGTFVAFDIENTALLDVSLLNGITITTYLNGNNVAVESQTGTSALLSVNTGLLTNSGRRTIGFVTTAPFDEVRLSISNTLATNVGVTRVYNVFFEKFCPIVLECSKTNYLNTPDFPVIIDDARTGVNGLACVGCSVQNTPNVISNSSTDYAVITTVVGAGAPATIAVKDVLTTYPAGSTAGFVIRDVNTILQVDLFNSITVSTYNNGVLQESRSGSNLLDLAVLNLLNVGLNGSNDYNIGFRTTLPYDEIQISVGSLASVINIIRVYGAFVDTRGSQDSNLNCCPKTAPLLSANTISNSCPAVTVNLNSLVTNLPAMGADSTVRWFTNNTATGTRYATPTMATAGTYYAFFFDTLDSCYGPASGAVTVTINPCPPTITSNGGGATASISVPENTTAVTTVVATDPENGTITYSITGGADQAKFSINPSTGVLTFNAPPNYENPTDVGGNNVYDVQVTATDPTNATDVQDIAVTVTNVLEDPIITSNGGGNSASISVVENTTAVTTVVATDPDNGAITYSITGGADAAKFSIDPMTGVLTFNTAPDFETPTDVGTNNVYDVQVTATDPSNATDVQSIAVTVTNVNEAPSITSDGAGATANIPVAENTTAVTTVTATDPENAYGTPKFSITGGADAAKFTINATTGALSFNTAPNFETPTDANADNNYEVTVRVTDAGGLFDEQAITVPVTNASENPVITSNGGGNSASVSIPENTTAVTTVVATDPDNGAITYSITGGADAALFSIDPMTGVLTFNTAPDFETPTDVGTNNVYDVQVTATDPSNATDVQSIAVTVTNVNEAPSITSDGAGATANIPVAENTTAVTTVTATDPENAYGTPKFSISGGADAAKFTINATTGALSFNTAPNFETPTDANTDNNYEVTVRVTDAGGLFDEQAITVPVTNASENPVITSNGGGNSASISVAENTTAVTTVVATDPDNGAITYSITGGADAAKFSIDPMTGVLTFNTAPDFENPTDVGTNNVYNVQVTATDASNATDVQDIAVTVTDVPESGPAFACNTPTRMNNPTYPTVINGANTGISGALCVLCAVNNANNAISSSTTDFASIILTAGIAATGSLSIQDPATDYPAGTFVGFDIENTSLVGTDLLDRVTITTYLNGNLVESFTGQSALISVGSSILTDNGRRVIGFISTGSFDEARISFSNTVLISLGTTRVYGAVFESFCGTTLECNETYALNNPEFSVIIDDALSGLDGVACVACSVADAPNAISADTTDYSTLTVITGTSATASLAVKDAVNTFPAGSTVGFTIRDVNTLAQVNLFSSISICTYNNGIQQECKTGNGLLDLSLLNNINASLNGAGDYNLGFRSTLAYDEVRITISAVAGVSNIIRVYGAFVDTRGAHDGNLNCCPSTAPLLSANTISNSCPAVTVDLNSLVTNFPAMGADSIVRWFTNNGATGTPYATPTMATAGTYYAFFFDTIDSCYGPASGAVTVTINPCPPTITSNGGGATASISVPENTTAVTTVVASDPENGTITYSITGGADAAKFSIDPMTGVLVFNTAPDYENPTDVGSDNVYDVQVTATDPTNATDVQDIAVTVTDVNEAPTITSNGGGATATIPVAENTTAVTTVTATDPENAYGTPKFSITGGADAAKFSIDPNTGALSFLTAPDFDVPTDANLDNNYEVQVTVTDAGNLTDVQDITVTVTDANENGLLSVRVLLQGALFNSPTPGVMRDDLRSGNYIPLNDPYTGSGNPRFAHAGSGGLASTTVGVLSANAGTNDAIVDWVFIELRSSLDPTIVVETRAALLQRDGDVVSPADGISPLALPGTVGNSYFVAVKHRNHLGVMTANLQAFTMAGTTVDFRTMSDADVYNFTSPFSYDGYEMVTVNGFKALWAGNANSDIKVKYQGPTNDNATVLNQVLTFGGNTLGVFNYDLAFGYFSGDINLDGKVKYQGAGNDPNFLFLNLITNFVLNSLDLYNYDLFIEQIP